MKIAEKNFTIVIIITYNNTYKILQDFILTLLKHHNKIFLLFNIIMIKS